MAAIPALCRNKNYSCGVSACIDCAYNGCEASSKHCDICGSAPGTQCTPTAYDLIPSCDFQPTFGCQVACTMCSSQSGNEEVSSSLLSCDALAGFAVCQITSITGSILGTRNISIDSITPLPVFYSNGSLATDNPPANQASNFSYMPTASGSYALSSSSQAIASTSADAYVPPGKSTSSQAAATTSTTTTTTPMANYLVPGESTSSQAGATTVANYLPPSPGQSTSSQAGATTSASGQSTSSQAPATTSTSSAAQMYVAPQPGKSTSSAAAGTTSMYIPVIPGTSSRAAASINSGILVSFAVSPKACTFLAGLLVALSVL